MHIPVNVLLREEDPRLSPAEAKAVFAALRNASPDAVARAGRGLIEPAEIVANARVTDDQTLRLVYDRYGEAGLSLLYGLTVGEPSQYFEWVLTAIVRKTVFIGSDKLQDNVLVPDNHRLPENPAKVARYNTNVLMPSLSHEIYHPGVRPGFLVHGMGGSRILVSHPFFDAGNESYSVLEYAPRIDSHLATLGINGAVCYFDLVPGLGRQLAGDAAWLAWFSLVATHSDAVVFIERESSGLTRGQRAEAEVVSDRVPKLIVAMTDEQLGHRGEEREAMEVVRIMPGEGFVTRERADEREAAVTRSYLGRYVDRLAYRTDRLHVVDRFMKARDYPLDHPMYGHLPMTTDTDAHFGPPVVPPELDFLKDLLSGLFHR